jgi:hypothetical protein
MTLISSYSTLQTAIVDYLKRDQDTQLTAAVPGFIQLTESKLNRTLFTRQMEQRSTTPIDITMTEPEFISLPTDFQSMRRIRLSSVTGKPCLEYRSGTQMDEFRFSSANVPHQPRYFTIMGSEIELGPTPDQNYTIEMIYRQNIPPLASNSTNWLLTLAPDIYLYGALMESAPYLKDDERVQLWATGFKTVLDNLNTLGLTSTFNASPLTVRTSGQTP